MHTDAGDRWRTLVADHLALGQRVRDPAWDAPADFAPAMVESFRAFPVRPDDRAIVDTLSGWLDAEDVVVDVGAGAGQFALPLAARVRRRLYVAAGSAADQRLEQAMAELLDERNGVLTPRTTEPLRFAVVRWSANPPNRSITPLPA
jgi:hypothetical protein